MKILTQDQLDLLKKPLPAEAVSKHPTKTYLSSIKAIYVTERMNEVFSVGAWRTKVDGISVSEKGMVVVKVIFEVPDYGIYYESFGGNDNGGESSKNFDLGDAYKGATTDALTKIGSYLGIGIDVFKGKGNSQTNYQKPTPNPIEEPKPKKELKVMQGSDFSKEWYNLIAKVTDGVITSISQIEPYYSFDSYTKVKIEELLKTKTV